MTERTRLVSSGDHPVVRSGLRGLIDSQPDFEVVGEAANGAEAVRLAERLHLQVVLMVTS